MITHARPGLVVLAVVASGCAWGSGDPFATVEPRLEARLDAPADRAREDGWWRLSSDYEIRFTAAEWELTRIELVPSAAATSGSFDPANPPPGYENCHGGHCHHSSGRLVDYEDIQAELAGGAGARVAPVMSLPVGRVALLTGETRGLTCEPSCELPLGRVARLRAPLTRVTFEGQVRDARVPSRLPGVIPWRLSATETAELTGDIDLPADRRHDPRVRLSVALQPGPELFDNVDWATATLNEGTIVLHEPANAAAWTSVRTRLFETNLRADLQRGPL